MLTNSPRWIRTPDNYTPEAGVFTGQTCLPHRYHRIPHHCTVTVTFGCCTVGGTLPFTHVTPTPLPVAGTTGGDLGGR